LTITGTAGEIAHSTTISINIPAQAGNYNFAVRAGATKIIVTCTWSGSGDVAIRLINPSTTYNEAGMVIYEKMTIRAETTTTYDYLKRAELRISAPTTEETWILQLAPQGVTTYTVNIEIT